MSGGSLPKTGLALTGTVATVGSWQISGLLAIVIGAVFAIVIGAVLVRAGMRRTQPAPALAGPSPAMALGEETAVLPGEQFRHRRGLRG